LNVKDLKTIDTEWAFDHDERIEMALEKFSETVIIKVGRLNGEPAFK
jgi:hypothetical protein